MRNLFMGLVLLVVGCASNPKNIHVVSLPPVSREPAKDQGLQEFGFAKEYWTAANCRLNMQDFALLQLISERSESENPFQIFERPRPASSAPETKDGRSALEKELEESVTLARRHLNQQLAGSEIPGEKESHQKLAAVKAELVKLETAKLIEMAQNNQRFAECTLNLSEQMQDRMGFGRDRGVYTKDIKEPIPLLDAVGLVNTVIVDPENGRKAAFDVPPPEFIMKDTLAFARIGSRAGLIVGGADWGMRSAVGLNLIPKAELRKGSATVMFRGEPVQYLLGTAMYVRPKDNRPYVAYVAPSERDSLLFDDETLNAIEQGESETSFSTEGENASTFKVGKSEREQKLSAHVAQCMRGFNGKADAAKITAYFNGKCRRSADQVALMIPVDYLSLPKKNWSEVRVEELLRKNYDKDVSILSRYGSPGEGLRTKEYLRLSGHNTDVDYFSSGILLVADRKKFESVAKAAGINVAGLVKEFNSVAAMALAGSGKTKETKKFKAFLAKGGMELFLALLAKDSDVVRLSFTQNLANNRVEIVGIASLATTIQEAIGQSDKLTEQERQEIAKLQTAQSSCAMQSAFLLQVLPMSVSLEAHPSKAQARAAIKQLTSLVDRASVTMEGQCKELVVKGMKTALKTVQAKAF